MYCVGGRSARRESGTLGYDSLLILQGGGHKPPRVSVAVGVYATPDDPQVAAVRMHFAMRYAISTINATTTIEAITMIRARAVGSIVVTYSI